MQMYLDTLMIRTRKVFGKCEFDKKIEFHKLENNKKVDAENIPIQIWEWFNQ